MFDYDKNAKAAVEILNEYDLSEELSDVDGMEIGEVQDILLQKLANNKEIVYAIESLTEYELCIYLKLSEKYNITFTEEVKYIIRKC